MRSSQRYVRTYASSPARRSNQTTLPCFACAGTALLLADVDLDAPVARLVDVVGGRHEKLALAAAGGLDLSGGEADLHEETPPPPPTPCPPHNVLLQPPQRFRVPRGPEVPGALPLLRPP